MRQDPVEVVIAYLWSVPGLPAQYITGDHVGHQAGEPMIYVEHSGGFRMIRDRLDRADITFDVYHDDRKHAVDLAYRCREALLEELPGLVVGGAEVLEVEEISSPRYDPDVTSREHCYRGEVAVFFVA
ncbi:hypothetical protein [Streptomyces sp. UNOB3_S3]|uniref:hypothetical protein n=1 Tax=Streptomyces sp. UNOB3_S3 TaxID=2871682 RepID=UPI001E5AEFAE|nr:hypothetical protein [Streptomyces sp. UNOB3_S3]MCC3773674.1 hypothetical protein [Streptomyces sp. UNOB3_S3]